MLIKSWRDDRRAALEGSQPIAWRDRFHDLYLDDTDEASAPLLSHNGNPRLPASQGLCREGVHVSDAVQSATVGLTSRPSYGSTL